MLDAKSQAEELKKTWDSDSRWKDVLRPYEAEDVVKLRGSVQIEHTLAKRCLLYTSPSPRDSCASRMPSSA